MDPQGSFADNSLMVLQSTAIGGAAGGVGGLAGAGMAGAFSGTGLSMATQALLTGATAGDSAEALYHQPAGVGEPCGTAE